MPTRLRRTRRDPDHVRPAPPPRIRPARARDVGSLVRLLGQLFALEADFAPDARRQRAGLALLLAAPGRRAVLVAERGGAVVGMVTAQLVVSTAEGGLSALVEDMVVDAAERGRGTGRALLEAIEGWARARGATRLQLLADRENGRALGFYAAMRWRGTRLVCLVRFPARGARTGGRGAEGRGGARAGAARFSTARDRISRSAPSPRRPRGR